MKSGDMKYRKTYINVTAVFECSGRIRPVSFEWLDGREYRIDSVTHVGRKTSSRVGSAGECYTVLINGRSRYLYLEEPHEPGDGHARWFIEEPVRIGA